MEFNKSWVLLCIVSVTVWQIYGADQSSNIINETEETIEVVYIPPGMTCEGQDSMEGCQQFDVVPGKGHYFTTHDDGSGNTGTIKATLEVQTADYENPQPGHTYFVKTLPGGDLTIESYTYERRTVHAPI